MKSGNNVSKFSNCYACGVCAITCPVNAISSILKDGFYHISVDKSVCIDCGKCLKTCSYNLFLLHYNPKFMVHIQLGAEMLRHVINRHLVEFFMKSPKALFQKVIRW